MSLGWIYFNPLNEGLIISFGQSHKNSTNRTEIEFQAVEHGILKNSVNLTLCNYSVYPTKNNNSNNKNNKRSGNKNIIGTWLAVKYQR